MPRIGLYAPGMVVRRLIERRPDSVAGDVCLLAPERWTVLAGMLGNRLGLYNGAVIDESGQRLHVLNTCVLPACEHLIFDSDGCVMAMPALSVGESTAAQAADEAPEGWQKEGP